MDTRIRLATIDDCTAIEKLIQASARSLGRGDYSEAEIETALQGAKGLDTQLVLDGTFFIALAGEEVVGCGGWSYRKTLFGSDAENSRDDALLEPSIEAARIRAFFVNPEYARQGIGSLILTTCENAARHAGFRSFTLGATLPGQRFYAARGYTAGERIDYDLGNGLVIPVIPMEKID